MDVIQSVVSSEALPKVLHYVGTHVGPFLAKLPVAQKVILLLGCGGVVVAIVDSVCRNGCQLKLRLGDAELILCSASGDFSAHEAEVINAD